MFIKKKKNQFCLWKNPQILFPVDFDALIENDITNETNKIKEMRFKPSYKSKYTILVHASSFCKEALVVIINISASFPGISNFFFCNISNFFFCNWYIHKNNPTNLYFKMESYNLPKWYLKIIYFFTLNILFISFLLLI